MVKPAPTIDARTAADIARQVQQLLETYAPEWQEFELDPATGTRKPKGVSAALIGVFARYCEIAIQRLNQVSNKNFLAFLNLLGASRLPPQPARVPLTFSLTGSTIDAVVPPGTQVAAPPAKGEQDPVIFETERELVVTAAKLVSVFVRDPQQDTWSDRSAIATTASNSGIPVFRGDLVVEHIFYLGHSQLLSFAEIDLLKLKINLLKALGDRGQVQWQIWQETADNATWRDISPRQDDTQNWTRVGEAEIQFGRISAVGLLSVNAIPSRWLRCRLLTPITLSDRAQTGMVRASQLPEIEPVKLGLEITLRRRSLPLAVAFTNSLAIDLSKPFFPFNDKPKFGDTLYLGHADAFSQAGASITLNIIVVNPVNAGLPPTNPSKEPELKLQWEFWDGTWVAIGTSTPSSSQPLASADFQDDTRAFTISNAAPLSVRFTLPPDRQPQAQTINGVESFWIRVRIVVGDYGKEASYVEDRDREGLIRRDQNGNIIYILNPASFGPPSIASVTVDYTWTKEERPEVAIAYNNAVYTDLQIASIQEPILPFRALDETRPSFYLGFTLPPNRNDFPNLPLSLFGRVADFKYGEKLVPISPTQSRMAGLEETTVSHTFWLTNHTSQAVTFSLTILGTTWNTVVVPSLLVEADRVVPIEVRVSIPAIPIGDRPNNIPSDRGFLRIIGDDNPLSIYSARFETFAAAELPEPENPKLAWQYWDGREWSNLTVRDDTENFTRMGLVEFLPPADISPRADFGLSNRYWLRVLWESGAYDIEPQLQKLLLNTTIATQTITITNEVLGSSNGSENQVFRTTRSPVLAGQNLEIREPELPSDRELEILETEGEKPAISKILDASGRSQAIWVHWHEVPDFYGSGPRDRHYTLNHITGEVHFGNGLNGLIPPLDAGNIRMARYQTGGGTSGNKAAGTIVQLKTTVPYIDKVTNPEPATGGASEESLDSLVVRAPRTIRHGERAVTLEDYEDLAMLSTPEVARAKCVPLRNLIDDPLDLKPIVPGDVSVIIVPRSTEAKPLPSLELLNRVRDYLETHALPTANISVVGPLYVEVSVTVEIGLTLLEGASVVEQAVQQKLSSFLHPLTGGLDGKGWDFGREPHKSDFYALLEAIPGVDHIRTLDVKEEDLAGAKQTGRFLVYSGKHDISLIFEKS